MTSWTDIGMVPDWVPDGATVVVGGAGLNRKPMSLVRALVAAGRRDLTLVSILGGIEVELHGDNAAVTRSAI